MRHLNTTLSTETISGWDGVRLSKGDTTQRLLHAERAMAGDMHSAGTGVPSSEILSDAKPVSASAKSQGKKYDSGKAPLAQGCIGYFRNALEAVAKISEYGAKKYNVDYSDQAWRKVPNARGRYMDAMARHLAAFAAGERLDPESGFAHSAHAAWNALALIELEKDQNDTATQTSNHPGYANQAGS